MPDMIQVIIGALNSIFDIVVLMIYLKNVLRKRNRKCNVRIYYISFILVCGIQIGVNWFVGSWALNMLCSLGGMFALTLLYENTMWTRIFAVISFQVFAMLSELLCYVFIPLMQNNELFISNENGIYYAAITLSRLLLFIIVLLVSGILGKDTSILKTKDYLLLIITPVVSMAIILAITFRYKGIGNRVEAAICIAMAGIMVINLILHYLLENIIAAAELRMKQSWMESQLEYQEKKYEQTAQSFKDISGIIHDTNKHLIYLRECILQGQPEEAVRYINKAVDAVENSYKRFNTGNLVVDALVSHAANMACSKGVSFKHKIQINKEKILVDHYDLSVILGNLLDNAMEACEKISDLEARHIEVDILTTDAGFMIHVANSAKQGVPDMDGITDKEDKQKHGYGISNIRAVVEKYDGIFQMERKEASFEATVILPSEESANTIPFGVLE